jgi:hypothetical protein
LEGRSENEQFTKWVVAGNLKGEDFPDKTRKILNEGMNLNFSLLTVILNFVFIGGLYAEVILGWFYLRCN